ncbi:MAG: DotU family type IV/VI secretion system protein [Nannocystaceae bacterium]|nr:DotU family type IV/VI secretion system protein [Nannocystaceae bacterium]
MERVNEVTQECFNALSQIRCLGEEGQLAPESFHARLITFVDAIYARGKTEGVAEGDTQEMVYAITALADEIALRKPGIREVWMARPLQYHYFGDHLAGQRFFERLQYHIADPSKVEVLRVYYLCLLFGFQGQYAQRGGELELAAVLRRVQDALSHQLKAQPLSMHHLRPKERLATRRGGAYTIWIGLFAILFSIALIAVLKVELNRKADSLNNKVGAMVTPE